MNKFIEITSTSQPKSESIFSSVDYDNNKDTKITRNKKKKCLISIFNLLKSFFMSPDSFLLSFLIFFNFLIIINEFYLGFAMKSVHMISDSVHGIIHIGSFSFALIAYVNSKTGNNLQYTYGYSRIETLSAFINCFFLMFLATFQLGTKMHHIFEEHRQNHHEKQENLIIFDVLKTVFNGVGILCFCRYAGSKAKIGTNESHLENFHTLFLHFLLDGLFNLCEVIFFYYGVLFEYKMDLIFNGFILILTIILCKPVLQNTGLILLQAFPIKDKEFISSVLREISVVEGVLHIKEKKFWGLHWGYLVCSLKILVRNDLNREESLKDIHQILKPKFTNICIEFVFDK